MVFRSCVLALAVSAVPILACDTHGSGGDGAPMGWTDGGTGSGGATSGSEVCTPDEFEEGPSLLDAANCLVGGRVLASCSPALPLLRSCDAAFIEACDAAGGDVHACAIEEIGVMDFRCDAANPLLPSCGAAFRDTCDEYDWQYVPGLGGERASCVVPPNPRNISCCELDVPIGNLKWKCTCDGQGFLNNNAGLECTAWLANPNVDCQGSLLSPVIHCDADYGFDALANPC